MQLDMAELLLHTLLVHPQCRCRTVFPRMTLARIERGDVHLLMEMDTFILLQPLRATVSYPLFLALEPAILPTPACQSVQGGWYYHFTGLKEVQVAEVEPMQEAHPVLRPVSSTLDDLFLPWQDPEYINPQLGIALYSLFDNFLGQVADLHFDDYTDTTPVKTDVRVDTFQVTALLLQPCDFWMQSQRLADRVFDAFVQFSLRRSIPACEVRKVGKVMDYDGSFLHIDFRSAS